MLAAPQAAAEYPVGAIVPRVECDDSPGQSYALYLPPGYSRDKAWPILYVFDPSARGALGARTFSEAASRHGWILASSNNTRSGSPDPNITAMRAVWRDTHERLSIDARRVYAAGYSGGARLATLMATTAPGTVAGVIGCGAGFHLTPAKKPPFVYFGAVGNRDFNYGELRDLREKLKALGAIARIEEFDGEHQWPPANVCGDAVEWMELEAIKSGVIRDPGGMLDAMYGRRIERARALESEHPADALAEYRSVEADFSGARDVSVAREAAQRLEKLPATLLETEERRRWFAEEDRARGEMLPVWAEIRSGLPVSLSRLAQELHIHELRAKAARRPVSEESLATSRLLGEISVQTSFSLAEGYRKEKDRSREILCLSIAAEARPESPYSWYNRAAAYAAGGEREKALDDLSTAVSRGFAQADALESDPDFETLRSDRRYRELLAAIRAHAPR